MSFIYLVLKLLERIMLPWILQGYPLVICLRSTLAAEPPDKELNGARLSLAELRATWLGRGDGVGVAVSE
jgi:hypothetical protein